MSTAPAVNAWLLAIRPRTLPAAVAPVLVGSALAWREGVFDAGPAAAALTGALLLQIGANLANDADDFARGADTAERQGPVRVTQSGLLTLRQVRAATFVTLLAASAVGSFLVLHAGWPILALGVAAILSALAYTGGPWPLGYHGLGEVFVFLFFGLAAVVGTHYVQALEVSPLAWWVAVPPGVLATAILVVNNVRDRETDAKAGKHTLAVRFGDRFGRALYGFLLILAYLIPALLRALEAGGLLLLLPLLTLPWAVGLTRRVVIAADGPTFNALLAQTAQLHLAHAALFSLGLVL